MRNTTIEWTDITWNPTDGCLVCSPGCANCYAMRIAGRFAGPGGRYEGLVTIGKNKRAIWTGVSHLNNALGGPLSWREPRKVFVNSMSDLFFEGLSDEDIAAVFAIMAACPHLVFQVLTKRATRMRTWYQWWSRLNHRHDVTTLEVMQRALRERADEATLAKWYRLMQRRVAASGAIPWPLPNVWVGVSVEDQKHGVPRIAEIAHVPARVRFLSLEPLLEHLGDLPLHGIGWAITGCESGPGARPARRMWSDQVAWYRSIRDQCRRAGVPFFLKQARLAPGITSTYGCRPTDVVKLPELDGEVHDAFPVAA